MICNERCKQSDRIMSYMTNDPSNHTEWVTNCVTQPGLLCKSLNVKQANTVDTETFLLRGEQSIGVEPNKTITPIQTFAETPQLPKQNVFGETTRTSKSCNGEKVISDRVEPALLPGKLPYMDTMIGTNSRYMAKYGEKNK